MNKEELSALVAQILGEYQPEPQVKGSGYFPENPGPQPQRTQWEAGDFVEDISELDLRKLYLVEDPVQGEQYRRIKLKTPARLGSGKAGPRYKTLTMLRFRADHAAAQDAVFSQVPEDYADPVQGQGGIPDKAGSGPHF
jgi:ethanolamine ammonia-lyase small subunit